MFTVSIVGLVGLGGMGYRRPYGPGLRLAAIAIWIRSLILSLLDLTMPKSGQLVLVQVL